MPRAYYGLVGKINGIVFGFLTEQWKPQLYVDELNMEGN